VYSKKVEYLHTLVYQALEYIAERKRKGVRDAVPGEAASDVDEFEEEQFLALDDCLEGEEPLAKLQQKIVLEHHVTYIVVALWCRGDRH
jgi:condensin-2 complex subunit H2